LAGNVRLSELRTQASSSPSLADHIVVDQQELTFFRLCLR
jgi:hypothetical protein